MSRPVAPFTTRVLAATRAESLAYLRRGESVLITILVPVIVLLFISWKGDELMGETPDPDRVVPSVLALALIASAFVSLAITVGFDRKYGVLRRLGVTPLGHRGLMCAKILATLGLVLLQTVVVLGTARVALGWHFSGDPLALGLFVLVGTVAFGALGLLLAGAFSAELTLALANAIFVVLALFGGVIALESPAASTAGKIAAMLPSAALGEGLRAACTGAFDGQALGVLAAWGVGASILGARSFRWD